MPPEEFPTSSGPSHKRTSSTAENPNHQEFANKRSTTDAPTPEVVSLSSVYIILETRTGEMDGTNVHAVFSSLTDANNEIIKMGECGAFDINSDDFEVEDEDGCLGFSAPDHEGNETNFQVIKKSIRPPNGNSAKEWRNKELYAKRESQEGSEGFDDESS
jgi:hypothetical protein